MYISIIFDQIRTFTEQTPTYKRRNYMSSVFLFKHQKQIHFFHVECIPIDILQ